MINKLFTRSLVVVVLCLGSMAQANAADPKPVDNPKQTAKALSLSGGYSRHLANGNNHFFGAQLNFDLSARLRLFSALQQSLSGSETARMRHPHETFVQHAERILRIETGVISPLLSSRGVRLNARGGVALWHTEMHTTIEDTPMGNFYNFSPMTLNRFAGHAGLELQANVMRHLGLGITAIYHLVPDQKYTGDYNMMGMNMRQDYVLRLRGLSVGVGLQLVLE
ncbi:hypothetical protein L0337_35280 [candidate division KSB1 bacterium]|nr:hypothetical protein [candidate division KSB1 bacterium]